MTPKERDRQLEEWMDRYGPAVLHTARRILGDTAAAQDVTQDTFVKAYLRAGTFRDDGHVRGFLLRTAVNDCRSRLRSPWSRREPLSETQPSPGSSVEDALTLRAAMGRLPSASREILWLHHMAGYSTAEIADMTGIRPAAVRKRLSRARHRLKLDLEGDTLHETV